jgi:perosamine synthetase
MIGYNYKMSDILAALGLAQLKRLNWVIQKKKEAAHFYEKLLSGVEGVQTPYVMPAASHTYMFYTLKFINAGARDLIMQHLEKDGIETVVAFPPLHLQPIYRSLCKYNDEDLSVTEDCAKKVLSLPIYPHIARHDQEFIINSMLEELRT